MTVALHDLTIRYGALVAVDRATAEFPAGAVGLLGRNGAGKSSILKALLGLVKPSGGSMRILDLPPNTHPVEIRRRVGYMPERDCHVPELNGFETVMLAARLTGVPPAAAPRRAHEILYLVGLEEQRYRPVSGYSAGMRQKIKLAVALVHDPDVLFLDEPTNGLDPQGRREMLAMIRDLALVQHKSIVLSSHILQDVENICHSAVLMDGGRVLAAGPLAELTRHAARSFALEAAGPREALAAELRSAGVLEVESPQADHYRLAVPDGLEPVRLFAAVQSAGGAVRRLVEHRRTLEEVFLGAVRDAKAGAP
jgi:ABC-2 type transport system ATP-binding protein